MCLFISLPFQTLIQNLITFRVCLTTDLHFILFLPFVLPSPRTDSLCHSRFNHSSLSPPPSWDSCKLSVPSRGQTLAALIYKHTFLNMGSSLNFLKRTKGSYLKVADGHWILKCFRLIVYYPKPKPEVGVVTF